MNGRNSFESAAQAHVSCLPNVKYGSGVCRGSHAVQTRMPESDTLLILQAFPGYGLPHV